MFISLQLGVQNVHLFLQFFQAQITFYDPHTRIPDIEDLLHEFGGQNSFLILRIQCSDVHIIFYHIKSNGFFWIPLTAIEDPLIVNLTIFYIITMATSPKEIIPIILSFWKTTIFMRMQMFNLRILQLFHFADITFIMKIIF